MKIRKAVKKDIPALIELFMALAKNESKISHLKRADKKTREFFAKGLPKWIPRKNNVLLIAEDKDKPVGYIFGWKEYISEEYKNPYVGYICECYVDKKYRGQGIAQRLLEKINSSFKKMGLKEAKLIVGSKNPSRKVWEHLGFKEEYKEMRKLL
jgi:ribosomal protein S18 acetylase RimI-like enzyme